MSQREHLGESAIHLRDHIVGSACFGNGAHYCLGAHLARIELAEALRLMAQRMPNIRRAGAAPWKPTAGISGPTSLPVEVDVVEPTPRPAS